MSWILREEDSMISSLPGLGIRTENLYNLGPATLIENEVLRIENE